MLKSIRGNLKGNLQAQRVGAGVGGRAQGPHLEFEIPRSSLWSAIFRACCPKSICAVLLTRFSLYHSLLIWQGGEISILTQCVKGVCKAAIWHLVKSSKKNDEVHMIKKNALYPCVVTTFTCIWAWWKQKTYLDFSWTNKHRPTCKTSSNLLRRKKKLKKLMKLFSTLFCDKKTKTRKISSIVAILTIYE